MVRTKGNMLFACSTVKYLFGFGFFTMKKSHLKIYWFGPPWTGSEITFD
jgi:hypothetical protein